MYSILLLSAVSFGICLVLTPLVTRWSRHLGMLDHPTAARNLHVIAVPRTGGIAIVVAYLGAIALLLLSPLEGAAVVPLNPALQFIPAISVIFALGLVDDLRGLDAWTKLAGQVAAAILAYLGGVHVSGFGGHMAPMWASLPMTIIWLVACANAFNLIDGMDGLASGIGLFATFTILSAALLSNNMPLAVAVAPLLGALLAFLKYNFNPASIFLGDGGSLSIGFLLGCFGAIWSQKSATLIGMVAPLVALAVPLADTGITVLRRFISRRPIFAPDRNHLHHRLLDRGLSTRQVALIVYAACGVAAGFSLLLTMPSNRFGIVLLIAFGAVAWVAVQLAGYVEFDTAQHLVLTGTFRHLVSARMFVSQFERKIAAAVTAEEYWETIREVGSDLECVHIRMALKGSVFDERNPEPERRQCCTLRIPLSSHEYVNFKYLAEASVRNAVAVSSIVEILQRSLTVERVATLHKVRAPLQKRRDIRGVEA